MKTVFFIAIVLIIVLVVAGANIDGTELLSSGVYNAIDAAQTVKSW